MGEEGTQSVSALVTGNAEKLFSNGMLDFTIGDSAGQSEFWQDPSHSSATYWSTDGKQTSAVRSAALAG